MNTEVLWGARGYREVVGGSVAEAPVGDDLQQILNVDVAVVVDVAAAGVGGATCRDHLLELTDRILQGRHGRLQVGQLAFQ